MRRFWLPAILILAFLLRFINLTSYPVGFNADEASFGYDAYSILKTGKDQWGNFLPLTLKSFGDYKAPLYGYLTVPFVAIFGLTPFAVRLPNVIVGTLAVYVLYLLTLEIKNKLKVRYDIEFISTLLLAISPWSVMLSRGGFEANLITLFIPLGIYLFLRGKFNWSALVFGLSLFCYHSAKLLSPVIFITLLLLFGKKRIVPLMIYILFLILMIWTLINGAGARISERSITVGALEEGARVKISLIQNGANPILAKLTHNKYQVVAVRFIENYKQYFSPRFLVSQGAGEYYYGMIHGIGVIYLFEAFLLFGLFKVFWIKKYRNILVLLVVWLLISPIPSALSTGVGFSGHRAIGMVPVLQILTAFGAYGWFELIKKMKINTRSLITFLFAFFVAVNVNKFISVYFRNIPHESYRQMLYGNLELSKWLGENSDGKSVLMSRSISEPQIFLAFAQTIDPNIYQDDTKNWDVTTWVDQIPVYTLKNYTIKSIDWKKDVLNENTIIVGRSEDFPKGVIPDMTFNLPDGSANIYVKYY